MASDTLPACKDSDMLVLSVRGFYTASTLSHPSFLQFVYHAQRITVSLEISLRQQRSSFNQISGFFEGSTGPDAQHLLDPSSMSVVIVTRTHVKHKRESCWRGEGSDTDSASVPRLVFGSGLKMTFLHLFMVASS